MTTVIRAGCNDLKISEDGLCGIPGSVRIKKNFILELYVTYSTAANMNCQAESSKKFHIISGEMQYDCYYLLLFSKECLKNSHFLQECFVFIAGRW